MTHTITGAIAAVVLIGLTLVTWQLAETHASAWMLAGVAMVKVVIIALVFLQMWRSWPVWFVSTLALVGAVLGLSAWMITG